ncbi:DUF4255 domain-containing protein [Archangium primigenium]|uniref:DUF4255 domain-containing protein n=1 Tax=[Archangium] primigenium TaxID=2792470 RepID=UPI0019597B80|nr:DUF4255 domain-containing protein [Archangium primigenium]
MTLKELLRCELPGNLLDSALQVFIGFATPDDRFPPASFQLPGINLFLYDVQENVSLRHPETHSERQDNGSVLIQHAPAWVDCHYMVTAHGRDGAQTPEADEHLLLGEALRVLMRHRRLPSECLQGSLKGRPLLPRTSVIPPESLRHGMELWNALRGKPRPSFHYTVTLPVEVMAPKVAEHTVRESVVNLDFKRQT